MELIRFQPGLGGTVEVVFSSFGVPGGPWGPAYSRTYKHRIMKECNISVFTKYSMVFCAPLMLI